MEDLFVKIAMTSGVVFALMVCIVNVTGEYRHEKWQIAVVCTAIISAFSFFSSMLVVIWS